MPFDPIRKREVAEEFNLELTLRTSFDPARPMGNVAVLHWQCSSPDIRDRYLPTACRE